MRLECREIQLRMGRTSITEIPGLDCGKDWNSLFTKVNKCYELRFVFETLRNMDKFKSALRGHHVQDATWGAFKSVCEFLRIAKVMTDMASSGSYVTMSLQTDICNSIVAHCDMTIFGQ
jgi:hypothetical protein